MSDAVKGADAEKAASQLEAYFLRRMLSEVQTGDALTGSGFAGGMFKDMLDEALSDSMAKAGGIGIADAVIDQIDPDGAARLEPADQITAARQRLAP
jgi:Rod binding domain-containing protein